MRSYLPRALLLPRFFLCVCLSLLFGMPRAAERVQYRRLRQIKNI